MIDLVFSEEEEMLRRQVADFARKEIKPLEKELAATRGIPSWLTRRLGEMGYLGVAIPEEWGGQGMSPVCQAIVMEELVKASVSASRSVGAPHVFYLLLEKADKGKIKDYYPAVAKGEMQLAFAITEPGAGTDVAGIKMSAVRDGNCYILNGEKIAISGGMLENLKVMVVYAKTDPSAGARGVSCFIVPADAEGVSRSSIPLMGWKGHTSASIIFDNVCIPTENLIGEEGKGFYYMMGQLVATRVFASLEALGLATASLEETMTYVKQRTSSGKPLAAYQGVSFKLAEDIALVSMARLFCYHTLRLREKGLPFIKEAAMCKWFSPSLAARVIHDCLLTHGHVGYSEEYTTADRMKQVIGYEIADGTPEAQLLIIVSQVLGKEFAH